MARTYKTPGVYREEIFLKPEAKLPTGVPGFVGFADSANEGEAAVALESLPPGIVFPTPLKDKVRYEAEQKLLVFRGAMSCADREQLLALSAEPAFTEAVAALYRRSQGEAAPNVPVALHRREEFGAKFKSQPASYLYDAVAGFFDNGGARCYVVRAEPCINQETALINALAALEPLDDLDLVAAPDAMSLRLQDGKLDLPAIAVQRRMLAHCAEQGNRMAILDSLPERTAEGILEQRDRLTIGQAEPVNGALYYPWLRTIGDHFVPACGHVAGIFARTDAKVGVFKAPANAEVFGVLDLETNIDNSIQDQLNPEGVNCLRAFPGRGIRVWGARTLSRDPNWRYVSVRRLFLTLRRWIDLNMAWATFEPNDLRLWVRIQRELTTYLTKLLSDGALKGATPQQAFFVKCDAETNPPELREVGQVVTEIGLAPLAPAEFIVIRIIHRAGAADTG